MERRPIKTRGAAWAISMAKLMANVGVTPNQISILSVVFSIISFVFFFKSNTESLKVMSLVLAAVFIQLRLICNLMDGMVAVEHKKKTKSGDIYNDVPDRFADVFIILGAGVASTQYYEAMNIAWLASVLAVMTAYVRVLGASLGTGNLFLGPMAKPHRMAIITIGAITDAILSASSINLSVSILYICLCVVAVGTLLTVARRIIIITKTVESK